MEPSIQGLRQDFSTTSGTRPFSPAHAFTLFSRELCRAELTLLSQEDDLDVAMEASCRLIRFGNRLHFRLLDPRLLGSCAPGEERKPPWTRLPQWPNQPFRKSREEGAKEGRGSLLTPEAQKRADYLARHAEEIDRAWIQRSLYWMGLIDAAPKPHDLLRYLLREQDLLDRLAPPGARPAGPGKLNVPEALAYCGCLFYLRRENNPARRLQWASKFYMTLLSRRAAVEASVARGAYLEKPDEGSSPPLPPGEGGGERPGEMHPHPAPPPSRGRESEPASSEGADSVTEILSPSLSLTERGSPEGGGEVSPPPSHAPT